MVTQIDTHSCSQLSLLHAKEWFQRLPLKSCERGNTYTTNTLIHSLSLTHTHTHVVQEWRELKLEALSADNGSLLSLNITSISAEDKDKIVSQEKQCVYRYGGW